jgi:tetratricopeptide (TPR) repeat protein
MGLWIIGSAWADLVNSVMPALIGENQNNRKSGIRWLVTGLGHVILGSPRRAIECFNNAVRLGYEQSGYLGLSAAYIELGKEKEAKKYNLKVLKINPKNKIAKRNLKYLNMPEEKSKN